VFRGRDKVVDVLPNRRLALEQRDAALDSFHSLVEGFEILLRLFDAFLDPVEGLCGVDCVRLPWIIVDDLDEAVLA
jgi:hypothetical protein